MSAQPRHSHGHQPNRQGIVSPLHAIISVLTPAMLIIPLGCSQGQIIFADIIAITFIFSHVLCHFPVTLIINGVHYRRSAVLTIG